MNVPIAVRDLLDAFEWVSSGRVAAVSCEAYVHRFTGQIYWCGDGIDEELPEDIEDGSVYIAVPSKQDLYLGRPVAIRFAEEFLPRHLDSVRAIFHKPGAYANFKSLLDRAGQLEAWYEYEENAIQLALSEWCNANGFVLALQPPTRGT